MIPKETVDQILDTARIEEVVGDFVTLKRRGSSYVACCPFHNEKTPSFHVTPSKASTSASAAERPAAPWAL